MMRAVLTLRQWFQAARRSSVGRAVLHWRTPMWGVRVILALWLIGQIAPAPVRAPLGEPQTVKVIHPQLCVHTRLIDEVPEYRIQQTFIAIREMGAGTIVEFFPWAYIEGSPGVYGWGQADKIFKHARNQGVKIIARMGFVPAWARPDLPNQPPTTLNTLPEDSFDEFAAFTALFAARYADQLDGIVIWNEPNLSFEWGFRPVDPAGYTRLLAASYGAIKAVAPDVLVLGGALAPTVEPVGSPNALNDLIYLDGMLKAGAGKVMDGLAIHTYGFTQPHDAAPAPDRLNFRRAELIHEVLADHGLGDFPVYITETGWNDHPRWLQAVTPSQRIDYTLGAYKLADETWPWAKKVCLWVFRYPAPTHSYPDYFTLSTTDFDLKPLYYALKAYGVGSE